MRKRSYRLIAIISSILLIISLAPTQLIAQEGFKVNTIVVCKNIEDRAPIEPGSQFETEVDKLFCFTGVANPGPPAQVTHVWTYGDEDMGSVPLTVGTSTNWRTWSSKKILPEWTGSWTITVLNPAGAEIGRIDFQIGPMEEIPPTAPEVEIEPAPQPAAPEVPVTPEAVEEPAVTEPEKVTPPAVPAPQEAEPDSG